MSNAMTVTAPELAILTYLTQIQALPGLWASSANLSREEVETVCETLKEKQLLVANEKGRLQASGHVRFLLDIAARAVSRAECANYVGGMLQSVMQLYAQGEDLLLANYHKTDEYEFLWVPTQQLAIGGMLSFLQADDEGETHAADGSAAPCPLKDGAEVAAWSARAPAGADALVLSYHSPQFPQPSMGMLRKDNRLYTKETPDSDTWLPLNRLDALLPVSRWLVHVHRAELLRAMEEKT